MPVPNHVCSDQQVPGRLPGPPRGSCHRPWSCSQCRVKCVDGGLQARLGSRQVRRRCIRSGTLQGQDLHVVPVQACISQLDVNSKSTPASVDLKLANHPTNAATYGLKSTQDQLNLDVAARQTAAEVDQKMATALLGRPTSPPDPW